MTTSRAEERARMAALMPRKYRWLTEGEVYIYGPKLGKGADDRRGQMCEVVTVPRAGSRPANVLVSFADGICHMVPGGVLRSIRLGGNG